jgi:hypothetical protein
MSSLQIIGEFRADEVVEVRTGIQPNPRAKEVGIVFVNVDNHAKTVVLDTKIPEDLSAGETAQDFHARGQVRSYAGPGTDQWMELIVTDDDGNQYNEWGNEIAKDDPRINRAIRILPADEEAE